MSASLAMLAGEVLRSDVGHAGVVDAQARLRVESTSVARVAGGCTIVGTRRADVLVGTRRADVMCGRGGNDVLRGRGGNDRLDGGAGADRLDGGAGVDVATGGVGADKVNGGAGSDRLYGGAGADRLEGRDGGVVDRLSCGFGADVAFADLQDAVALDCEGHAPTDIALSPATVDEHEPTGTTVGTLTTSDRDVGDRHRYALVVGPGDAGNGAFRIEGATLKTAASLDHEATAAYTVRLRAADRVGRSVEKVFAIAVTNVNEPPVDIALSSASTAEHEPAGTAVGTFKTSDPDVGDAHTYALVSGPGDSGNGGFRIEGATLKTAVPPDHEANATPTVRVQASDRAGRSVVKVFAITVGDANDPPAGIALWDATVAEHEPAGTAVGTLAASDPDAGDTHAFALVAGSGDAGNAAFRIEGAVLETAAPLDHESSPSYTVRVRATDGIGESIEHVFAITVSDATFDGEGVVGGIHAESSNRLGPFLDRNGNLYFLSELQAIPPDPGMRKSTDGGGRWSVVGDGNAPEGFDWQDLESVWVEQDGSTLRILRQRSGTIANNVAYMEFETSDAADNSDKWGLTEPVVGELAADTNPDDQAVALAVRSNGDLYAFYRTTRDGPHDRVAYRKKPAASGSWGEEVIVAAAPETRYTQIQAIAGDDDRIHIFYKDDTNGEIEYRTLDNGDLLSSAAVVNDELTTSWEHPMATPALSIDADGVERIFVAWARADGLLVSAKIENGAIGAEEVVSGLPTWIGGGMIGSRQVVATLAVDPVTDNVYALYADAATHDVHRDTWNGSWGTDVEVLDAVEAQYISANVFTRAANRVLAVVYDDNPTGALDAGVPMYREFVVPPAP